MPKLTIHIGAGKTGSSAIQAFLKCSAAALASKGIIVPTETLRPDGHLTGYHVWYFDELRRSGIAAVDTRILTALNQLVASAQSDVRQIILSAENLSNPNGWDRLFASLASTYNIHIVLYIRRQDDYLLSAWQQWYSKESRDFWAWLTRCIGIMANWRLTLQEWEKVVAPENISVRVFDRRHLVNNNVVDDFRQFIDTDAPLPYVDKEINRSLNAGVLDLFAGNRTLFESIHDNGFLRFVEALTGSAHCLQPGQSILTLEQRLAILSRYQQSNSWVKQKYVRESQPHGLLFTPPSHQDYRELSREDIERQKWDVVGDLLYRLYLSGSSRPR